MSKIAFGTDGWRAIIAKDFTVQNVQRVSKAVARWLHANYDNPSVVIGHDCRFAGPLFMQEAAKIFIQENITVYYAHGFVSTPMVSMATLHHKAQIGVVITASHNPPDYNGYKLKGSFGGPLLSEHIAEVEALIEQDGVYNTDEIELSGNPKYIVSDFQAMYRKAVEAAFDLKAIQASPFRFGYDAMYGAGQAVMQELFPTIEKLHCTHNPGFDGIAPEPILRNLQEFAHYIKTNKSIDCGLTTDGDADRIGLFDGAGEFVDSHHIILLLIHYLVKYKGVSGKVVTAFSTTEKVRKLCAHYQLEHLTTKIGFKHITGHIINEDVLLGGEESGGIAIKGHIPERDGIWMGLVLWEFMAKSGKSLTELIQEVYDIVGPFAYERLDLHLPESQKQKVLQKCLTSNFDQFGARKVLRTEDLDGFKYHFEGDAWLLIRASGTEPVLRIYAETSSRAETLAFIEEVKQIVLSL